MPTQQEYNVVKQPSRDIRARISIYKDTITPTLVSEMLQLQEGGNVDLLNRPQISLSMLRNVGWSVEGNGVATVFSHTYSNSTNTVAGNFTPIIYDSNLRIIDILEPSFFTNYCVAVCNGTNNDYYKLQIGNLYRGNNCIQNAMEDAIRIHELQESYYLNSFINNLENIGSIDGVVTDSPIFTNNSTSDIRRTCNITLHPIDSSFDLVEGSKLWLDKYIKVELGIYDIMNNEYVYTNMGYYIADNPSQSYSATDNRLSFTGSDFMAKLTGLRGGNLEGLAYEISANTNVKQLLIDTLALFRFTDYEIDEYPITTPNKIEISSDSSAYTIIKNILDILPNWQAYFDVDGIFHFNQIPNGENETVVVNDDIWQSVLINYNKTYDEDNIKNYIEVLGREHENTMACGSVSIVSGVYVTTSSEATSLTDMLMFSFTTPSNITNDPKININSWGVKNIRNIDGTIPNLLGNTYYVIQYMANGDYFQFLSSVQPIGIAYENNPDSPFYINKGIGKLRIVLSGGEYDNIGSDYLAQQRARFELYQRCRLLDSINITIVPIYWLDTNWLIEITLPNKNSTEETNQYLIKTINTTFGVSGTQNISLMRYYPYYPSI